MCPTIFEDKLYFISYNSGEIYSIEINNPEGYISAVNTGGQPSAFVYDPSDVFYVTDFAHRAVMNVDSKGENRIICAEYEMKNFLGPSSIVRSRFGNIFFTDSGPIGETSIAKPNGAIYQLEFKLNTYILVPIVEKGLAYPCGIAFSPTEKYLYVCEFSANRIIRLTENPKNVYQVSVFYQFNGKMGPKSICVSKQKNYLFVGLFDYPCNDEPQNGIIAVINQMGELVEQISIPEPDITGLCLSPDEKILYVTVGSASTIYSIDVTLITY